MADQSLTFKKPINYKELQIASHVMAQEKSSPSLEITKIDLNDDFIDEYVTRDKKCARKKLCKYVIVGFMNRSPLILGQFDAHQIRISDKKDYGISRLIVYNKENNDFASNIAAWNPNQYRYILLNNDG